MDNPGIIKHLLLKIADAFHFTIQMHQILTTLYKAHREKIIFSLWIFSLWATEM